MLCNFKRDKFNVMLCDHQKLNVKPLIQALPKKELHKEKFIKFSLIKSPKKSHFDEFSSSKNLKVWMTSQTILTDIQLT